MGLEIVKHIYQRSFKCFIFSDKFERKYDWKLPQDRIH